jgi:hypothetical protein
MCVNTAFGRATVLALGLAAVGPAVANDDDEASRVRFDTARVVASGDPAPGFDGLFFEHFGARDGLGFDLGPPRIDRTGVVHFTAHVGADGDPGTIEGLFPQGVFRGAAGGAIEAVARIGDAAPGVAGATFTSFPSEFGHTPGAHAGRTTFVGSTDFGITFGLWSDRFDALAPVLLPGDRMPDTPPGTGIIDFAFTTRGDAVVINALFSAQFADEGLWINADGTWRTIAARGVKAPGTPPGVVFDAGTSLAFFGPVDRWDVNEHGVAVLNGYLGGPGIVETNDEGLWLGAAGALSLIAREGAPAPGQGEGVVWGSGTGLQAFADEQHVPATINDRGAVLFGATLRGPGFDHLEGTFLRRANGALERIATGSSGLPGSPDADPAPGLPAHHFATFLGGSLNERNHVAFIGTATDTDVALGDVRVGIWSTHRGGLELVAAGDEPVPGVPGATFNNDFGNGLALATLSDDDVLYFVGTFGSTTAVFASPRRGRTVMVVREGRPLDLGGDGSDVRIPRQISLGAAHADNGARAIEIAFTDGTSALVVTTRR